MLEYLKKYHPRNQQSNWLGYWGNEPDFLEKNLDAYGLTERYDESMLLFSKVIGLNLEDVLYVKMRADKEKFATKLSDEEKQLLLKLDSLDFELYEQAKINFDKQLAKFKVKSNELKTYKEALLDYNHPLWQKRGAFPVGYTTWKSLFGRFKPGKGYINFYPKSKLL